MTVVRSQRHVLAVNDLATSAAYFIDFAEEIGD